MFNIICIEDQKKQHQHYYDSSHSEKPGKINEVYNLERVWKIYDLASCLHYTYY